MSEKTEGVVPSTELDEAKVPMLWIPEYYSANEKVMHSRGLGNHEVAVCKDAKTATHLASLLDAGAESSARAHQDHAERQALKSKVVELKRHNESLREQVETSRSLANVITAQIEARINAMTAGDPVAWMNKGGDPISCKVKAHLIENGVLGGEFKAAATTAERYDLPLYLAPPAQPSAAQVPDEVMSALIKAESVLGLGYQTGMYAYAGENMGRYMAEARAKCKAAITMLAAAPQPAKEPMP